jgi:pimeloyl-ACP methyl ester carboxylesterase
VTQRTPIRYVENDGVHIAYEAVGEGERDLVLVQGFMSHLDLQWENPALVRLFQGLNTIGRLILFDKRGTGLSDRAVGAPTLEERMDDVRAVMDAAGSERATLMGISEGAPMCLLFAATHPERTDALVLHGGMARTTEAPDYPWAPPADGLIEAASELVFPVVYDGEDVDIWTPSLINDPQYKDWLARYRRAGVSPDGMRMIYETFLEIDVRDILPTITVPTLVVHRRGDRVVNRRAAKWMADQIPGARYVELPGQDHLPWAGDADAVIDEVREFLTGVRVGPDTDRVLATVMFTDVVGSTERVVALGDRKWKDTLEVHDRAVRQQLDVFRGHEINTMGDGFLATFDGPARAIQCSRAIREASGELGVSERVGLHTGEIEVRGEEIGGVAVHIGQRVSALAQPSEILVSSTVKDLVAGSGIRFEDRGEHQLKGVPDRWRLYAVGN